MTGGLMLVLLMAMTVLLELPAAMMLPEFLEAVGEGLPGYLDAERRFEAGNRGV